MKSVAALLLFSSLAQADHLVGTSSHMSTPNKVKHESPQWFSFEVKFGSYSPHIDSAPEFMGKTPFSDLFNHGKGQPSGKLLTELELDFQFFHKFGSLAVGVGWGMYRRTTHSFEYTTQPPTEGDNGLPMGCVVKDGNCMPSGDTTAINFMPFELLLIYRFDYLMQRWRVPFVPYMKAGLAYYLWWIENGSGSVTTAMFPKDTMPGYVVTKRGNGGTFGWTLRPGMSFLLDVIDPGAARTMDNELGINHSYLFAEMNMANIDGFGASNKLVLSDLTFSTGLAFEF